MAKKFALISVYDKTGIVEFARQLIQLNFTIISTGGTHKILSDSKIPVTPIQEITGNPESFDGRMKTISFQIESGILYDRQNPQHVLEAKKLGIPNIELVVCNLYPFEKTISNKNTTLAEAIEQIDVGGPTMLRAGAKNFKNVLVVVDPKDYQTIADYLVSCHPEFISGSHDSKKKEMLKRAISSQNNKDEIALSSVQHDNENGIRKNLAAKTFAHLSFYDAIIAQYLDTNNFNEIRTIPLRKVIDLRYGENPHQKATLYSFPHSSSPLLRLEKQWGRELSYVNVTDIQAGLESVQMFSKPCAVVIKHNSPCGIALGKTSQEALKRAIKSDPESAFGGIIVLNKPMDLKTALEISKFKDETHSNIDIVAVPSITTESLEFLKKVRKTMGIYTFGKLTKKEYTDQHFKMVDGGFIIQEEDNVHENIKNWKIVTKKKPSSKQMEQMKIAWKFISRIKSNAIIVVDKTIPMTRGIGCGQTSRIRSAKIALEQANDTAKKGVLASDSFFPFDDCVKLAHKYGISAIVQQGGSINDQASIDTANSLGIAMVFTGKRAFWH